MADIFISYSRKDKPFVVRLNDALKKTGKETWVDWEGILPSEEWLKEIYAGIEAADTVVYVLSPDSAASEVCGQEIAHAIKFNKRLVPIVCRDVNPKDVPKSAAAHNWIFFREGDDFEASFELLLKAVNTDIDWVRTHTRLLTRAIEWDGAKRDPSVMLSGRELRRAEQWLAKAGANMEPHPSPLQTEYILSSRRQASLNNFRVLVVTVIIAFAAAILLLLVRENKQRANLYLAEELQSKAIWALTDHDVDTAEVLLAKSMALDDRPETRERFLEARSRAPKLAQVIDNPGYRVMAVSRNGKRYVLSADQKSMVIGRIDKPNNFIRLASVSGVPTAVRFGQNGRLLAAATPDAVKVFGTEDGRLRFSIPTKNNVTQCLSFTRDGKLLATGGKDLVVKVWSTADGHLIRSFVGHKEQVSCIAFSPDGKTLASAGWEHDVLVWDVATGKNLFRLKGHQDIVNCLAFSPDGKTLASGGLDNTIYLWDVKTGHNLRTCEGESTGIVSLTFTPDGNLLFSGSDAGRVRTWDVATGHNLLTIKSNDTSINSMAYLPNTRLLVTACDDGFVEIWDMGYPDRKRELTTLRGHKGVASMVTFAPDGRTLGSSSEDNTAKLWDTTTGTCVRTFVGHTNGVESVNFTPDGRTMVTGSRDATCRVWDVATGKTLHIIKNPGPIRWVQYSPDGKELAVGCDDKYLRIYDAETYQLKNTLPAGDTVLTFNFEPRTNTLAVGSQDGRVRMWNASTLKSTGALRGHTNGVWGIGFNPSGTQLISGSQDGTLRIWNIPEQKDIATIQGHQGAIWDIAVEPGNRYFASAGADSTVKIWDMSNVNGSPTTLRGTDGPVWGVDYNNRGTLLASGGQDWAVRVWNMNELRGMLAEDPSSLLYDAEQETGLTVDTVGHQVVPLSVQKLVKPAVTITKLD